MPRPEYSGIHRCNPTTAQGVVTCSVSSLGQFTSPWAAGDAPLQDVTVLMLNSVQTPSGHGTLHPRNPGLTSPPAQPPEYLRLQVCTTIPSYSLFLSSNPSGILIHSYVWSTCYMSGTRDRMGNKIDMIPAIMESREKTNK